MTKKLLDGGAAARVLSRLPGALIALVLVLALVPVGAQAAGNLVTLVDGTTDAAAHVDHTGALRVAANAALPGFPATPERSMQGHVRFTNEYRQRGVGIHSLFRDPFQMFSFKDRFALTNLVINNQRDARVLVAIGSMEVPPGGNCGDIEAERWPRHWSGQGTLEFRMQPNSIETFALTQPMLFSAPPGSQGPWCLAIDALDGRLHVNTVGYRVVSP